METNKYPGIMFVALSFGLAWSVIGLVTWAGEPSNSLHTSAQAWAFVVVLGVLGAYGVSSVVDLWRKP